MTQVTSASMSVCFAINNKANQQTNQISCRCGNKSCIHLKWEDYTKQ